MQRYGTNPNSRDTDGDGLGDREEIGLRTSPRKRDTDGDGLEDKHELDVHKTDPTRIDTDGDELGDGEELTHYGSNPLDTDTDDDHLTDRDEVMHAWPSNPRAWDSDADGVGDLEERKLKSKPMNPDTDDDGLGDGHERSLGTSVTEADTDYDTLSDFTEWHENFDPGLADSNQDGVRDDEAFRQGLPPMADSDGDGFSDLDELKKYRTNPFAWDMDGDCVPDSVEVLLGRTSPRLAKTDRKTRDDHVLNAAGLFPEWELLGCARVNSSLVVWRVPKAGKAEPLDPGNVYWTHDLGLAVEVENPHCYPYMMHVIAEEVLDPDQPMDLARTYYHSLVYGRNRILIPVWSSPSGTVTLKLKDGNGRVYAQRILRRKKDIRIADVIRVDYDKVETSIYDAALNTFTGDLYPTDRAVIYYIDNAHPFPVTFTMQTPYGVSKRIVNIEYPVLGMTENSFSVRIPPGVLGVRVRVNLKPAPFTSNGETFGGTGAAGGAGGTTPAVPQDEPNVMLRGTADYVLNTLVDPNYAITSIRLFSDPAFSQPVTADTPIARSENIYIQAVGASESLVPPFVRVRAISDQATPTGGKVYRLPKQTGQALEFRGCVPAGDLVPTSSSADDATLNGRLEVATFDLLSSPDGQNKSNYSDTDALADALNSMPTPYRIRTRSRSHYKEKVTGSFKSNVSQMNKKTAGFAGLETITFESLTRSAPATFAFVENQADVVMFSGHEKYATGKLQLSDPIRNEAEDLVSPDGEDLKNWRNGDVDIFVISGCAVLEIKNYRSRFFEGWALRTRGRRWLQDFWCDGSYCSPGMKWENTGPKVILGYAWSAGRDVINGVNVNARIMQDFVRNWGSAADPASPTYFKDAIKAWLEANRVEPQGHHACAIDARLPGQHVFYGLDGGANTKKAVLPADPIAQKRGEWPDAE